MELDIHFQHNYFFPSTKGEIYGDHNKHVASTISGWQPGTY